MDQYVFMYLIILYFNLNFSSNPEKIICSDFSDSAQRGHDVIGGGKKRLSSSLCDTSRRILLQEVLIACKS